MEQRGLSPVDTDNALGERAALVMAALLDVRLKLLSEVTTTKLQRCFRKCRS